MNDATIEEFELDVATAKEHVALADALGRLQKSKDFKLIINEGYIQKEAIRLVSLKAHPAMQEDKRQAAIVKSMDAIGSLEQYFSMLYAVGANSELAIDEANEAIVEMSKEDNS
jgi:hypothetical protein